VKRKDTIADVMTRRAAIGAIAATVYTATARTRNSSDFNCAPEAGAATNTAGLKAGISDAARGSGLFEIESGIFNHNGLVPVSGVEVRGKSRQETVLRLANGANDNSLAIANAATYVDDFVLRSLTIDGNKANNKTGVGVYLNGRRCALIDLMVRNSFLAGVILGAPGHGARDTPLAGFHKAQGLWLYNCSAGSGWGAFAITHGKHIVVDDFHAWADDGLMAYGFDIEPESGDAVEDIQLSNFSITQGRITLDGANLGGSNVASELRFSNGRVDARGSYSPADSSNMAPLFLRQLADVGVENLDLVGHDMRTYGGIHADEAGSTTTWNVDGLRLKNVNVKAAGASSRAGRFSVCRNVTLDACRWDVNSSASAVEFPGCSGVRGTGGTRVSNAGAGRSIDIGSTASDVRFDETTRTTGTVTVSPKAAAKGCEVRRVAEIR